MKSNRPTDRGSTTVELVLVAPVLLVLALFTILSGRSGEALRQVQHAADHGARAASQVAMGKREAVGLAAARSDLDGVGHSCRDSVIAVQTTKIGKLNAVKVTVSCRVEHAGLELLGLSARTVSADSIEVIDVYRAK